MKRIFLLLLILSECVFAQSFNFNASGDEKANDILKNYIQNEYDIEDVDSAAYFYDVDQDGEKDVLGIVKSNIFYNMEGYKLIVLKKEGNDYKHLKCDIFFDNTKDIVFEKDNKITYYKSVFYKNKKYSAYIRNSGIKTIKTPKDKLTDNKMKNIEQLTRHVHNENVNVVELSDFKTLPERNVNIRYRNLSDRTKHYLDMK